METHSTSSFGDITDQYSDFLIREVDVYALFKYQIILDWLGDINGLKTLVVGTGSGELSCLLSKGGALVHAIDIDSRGIDLTLKNVKKSNLSIETSHLSLFDLPQNRKYDLVIATDVIEHIENDIEAANKLKSLMSSGGRLVISVPSMQSLFGLHDEMLGHYRRYTKKNLRKLFLPDLKIMHERYYGLPLIPIALLYSKILRKAYPVAKAGVQVFNRSISGRILYGVFNLERMLFSPLGTSLLTVFKKP